MASLLWPSHPGPVQSADAAAEGISLAMLKVFLISTTAFPQQEHSISKSGDAPKSCLVSSIKIPHSLYLTSL